jgi:hypothetical protein
MAGGIGVETMVIECILTVVGEEGLSLSLAPIFIFDLI